MQVECKMNAGWSKEPQNKVESKPAQNIAHPRGNPYPSHKKHRISQIKKEESRFL